MGLDVAALVEERVWSTRVNGFDSLAVVVEKRCDSPHGPLVVDNSCGHRWSTSAEWLRRGCM